MEDRKETDAILDLIMEEETRSEELEAKARAASAAASNRNRSRFVDEQVYTREQVQEQEQVCPILFIISHHSY